jgi:hypothetical protein
MYARGGGWGRAGRAGSLAKIDCENEEMRSEQISKSDCESTYGISRSQSPSSFNVRRKGVATFLALTVTVIGGDATVE